MGDSIQQGVVVDFEGLLGFVFFYEPCNFLFVGL